MLLSTLQMQTEILVSCLGIFIKSIIKQESNMNICFCLEKYKSVHFLFFNVLSVNIHIDKNLFKFLLSFVFFNV